VKRLAAGLVLGLLLLAAFVYWPREAPETGTWMAAAGVEPRYEILDGRRIRYVRRGRGPAVVLLHGIASSMYTWKDLLPGLAADHDVVAMDFPGFGGSDVPPALSAELLRATVVGLMDRLALPQATLVGNSLGGATATFVAARDPERVSRLVLIDAAGFRMAAESRPAILRYTAGPLGSMLVRVPRPRPILSLGLRQVFFDDRLVTPERVDEYEAPLLRPGALAAIRSLLRAPAPSAAEYAAMLRGLRQPSLVLWGAEDRWIPPSDADLYTLAIPGARKRVLSECGHMPQEERPAETLRLVREFIAAPQETAR
jgi:pimeloyl-ACP methyl ester carboxylesterase